MGNYTMFYCASASYVLVNAVVAQGKMARCSFHGSPAKGVQVQGANTYYNIVPSPQLAARALGSLSTEVWQLQALFVLTCDNVTSGSDPF